MLAATRARFTSRTDQTDLTAGNAVWETPPALLPVVERHLGLVFDVDVCADAQRALREVWFGPGSDYAEDALTARWSDYGQVGWCNPPYGAFIARILPRAVEEARLGFTSVFLIPMRFTRAVRAALFQSRQVADWLIPDKRITFYENGAPRTLPDRRGVPRPQPALFDSTFLVFRPGVWSHPRVDEIRLPAHA